MLIISPSEHEELVEHLEVRPDIWVEHEGVWIRRVRSGVCKTCTLNCEECGEQEYVLALTFVMDPFLPQTLQNGMVGLIVKGLVWSQGATDEYVLWLLEKYTAYAMRQQIIMTLAAVVKPTTDIQSLSNRLCELQGGVFLRKHERTMPSARLAERAEIAEEATLL